MLKGYFLSFTQTILMLRCTTNCDNTYTEILVMSYLEYIFPSVLKGHKTKS
jgi:hypothetical protein